MPPLDAFPATRAVVARADSHEIFRPKVEVSPQVHYFCPAVFPRCGAPETWADWWEAAVNDVERESREAMVAIYVLWSDVVVSVYCVPAVMF